MYSTFNYLHIHLFYTHVVVCYQIKTQTIILVHTTKVTPTQRRNPDKTTSKHLFVTINYSMVVRYHEKDESTLILYIVHSHIASCGCTGVLQVVSCLLSSNIFLSRCSYLRTHYYFVTKLIFFSRLENNFKTKIIYISMLSIFG